MFRGYVRTVGDEVATAEANVVLSRNVEGRIGDHLPRLHADILCNQFNT